MINREFYFNIDDLFADAETKAQIRASGFMDGEGAPVTQESILLSEEDHPMMHEWLRAATESVFTKIQTLVSRSEDAYDYDAEENRIYYKLQIPHNFDLRSLKIMYGVIKDYFVEALLNGFYTERNFMTGAMHTQRKMEQFMERLTVLRLSRVGGVRTSYNVM